MKIIIVKIFIIKESLNDKSWDISKDSALTSNATQKVKPRLRVNNFVIATVLCWKIVSIILKDTNVKQSLLRS